MIIDFSIPDGCNITHEHFHARQFDQRNKLYKTKFKLYDLRLADRYITKGFVGTIRCDKNNEVEFTGDFESFSIKDMVFVLAIMKQIKTLY